eukprot:351389-Chlamydomonas_euryale.AAC.5
MCDSTPCSARDVTLSPPAPAVKAELSMLTGMRTQRRVCVATMGGGAAAAREAYQQLWGSVIVRVDDADGPKGAKGLPTAPPLSTSKAAGMSVTATLATYATLADAATPSPIDAVSISRFLFT